MKRARQTPIMIRPQGSLLLEQAANQDRHQIGLGRCQLASAYSVDAALHRKSGSRFNQVVSRFDSLHARHLDQQVRPAVPCLYRFRPAA